MLTGHRGRRGGKRLWNVWRGKEEATRGKQGRRHEEGGRKEWKERGKNREQERGRK